MQFYVNQMGFLYICNHEGASEMLPWFVCIYFFTPMHTSFLNLGCHLLLLKTLG